MSYLFTAPYTLPKPRPDGPFLRKYGRVVEKVTAPAPVIVAPVPEPVPLPPPPEPEPVPVEAIDVLPRRVRGPHERVLTIIDEVSEKHGISVADLRGRSRKQPIALARQEVCFRAAKETKLSLPQIGKFLDGRDHTTILHGVRAHAERHGLPIPDTFFVRLRKGVAERAQEAAA